MTELAQILGGETESQTTEVEAEAVETEQADAGAQPEGGDEAQADAEPNAERDGLLAALQDERAKRQELEQRFSLIEQQQQRPDEPDEPPQFVPDGADFFENPQQVITSAINSAVQHVTDKLTSQYTAQRAQDLSNFSEQRLRDKHGNEQFDSAVEAFKSAARSNPTLLAAAQAVQSQGGDIMQHVYTEGKRLSELAPYDGDVGKMAAAIEKRVRDEIAAEQKDTNARKAPGSVTRGAKGGGNTPPTGVTPLEQILRG